MTSPSLRRMHRTSKLYEGVLETGDRGKFGAARGHSASIVGRQERKGRAVTDPPDVSPADTISGRPCGRHDLRERTRIPHSEVSEHLAINLDVR